MAGAIVPAAGAMVPAAGAMVPVDSFTLEQARELQRSGDIVGAKAAHRLP